MNGHLIRGSAGVSRRGLTLMELVVVMVILIGLAGLMLPLFPSMLARAHTSTSATNGQEITKAVQMYQTLYFGYPNGLDNLATSATTVFPPVAGGAIGTNLTAAALTQPHADALAAAGVTTAAQCAAEGDVTDGHAWSATFAPYATLPPAVTTLSDSTPVATLGADAKTTLGFPAAGTYVVFGLGGNSSMKGKTMDGAPVHFSDEQNGANPQMSYARFGLVFQVRDAAGPLEKAQFVGTVAFHNEGVVGNDAHLAEYFNAK